MNRRESFDDALDRAIDALKHGDGLDRVLAQHPRHADALRPLLETVQLAAAGAPVAAAMSPRLADNVNIVRAAVQRAQMAAQPLPMPPPAREPAWWQRRLAFASLSLPAGAVVLLLLAGASGAAAASMAVTGNANVPAAIFDLVKEPQRLIGGSGGGSNGTQHPSPDAHGLATSGASETTATPGSANAPKLVTLQGTISDIHGNVFTLTTGDGPYKVNTDANTALSGTMVDGAQATVTGDVTAEKNLHATSVTVGGSAQQPGGPAGATATPGPQNDQAPGLPDGKTPGPPLGHTPSPPADHTPPGQGNGNGGTSGNGSTQGGGNSNAGGNGNGGGNGKP